MKQLHLNYIATSNYRPTEIKTVYHNMNKKQNVMNRKIDLHNI